MLRYNNKVTKAKAKSQEKAGKSGEPTLPPLRLSTLKKPQDSLYGLIEMREKVRPILSSPSQRK
jgi:hypothetical protein